MNIFSFCENVKKENNIALGLSMVSLSVSCITAVDSIKTMRQSSQLHKKIQVMQAELDIFKYELLKDQKCAMVVFDANKSPFDK